MIPPKVVLTLIVILISVSCLAVDINNNAKAEPRDYGQHAVCTWDTGVCDIGLDVSGALSSSVEIAGLPGVSADVEVETHEPRPAEYRWTVAAPARTIELTFYKTRSLFPAYDTTATTLFQHLGFGAKAVQKSLQVIMNGISNTAAVTVKVGSEAKTFTVWIQWRPWAMETGGFYAFTWAHDQILVTEAVKTPDPAVGPQTHVVATRSGDRVGPLTGITFVFHPGNYPNFGFEFGTAANGNRPNSYYLGAGFRLLQRGDLSLLTITGGISHVTTTTYPGILPDHVYAADDPLLTGRARYTNRPYIALGLGINLSGGTGSSNKTKGQ